MNVNYDGALIPIELKIVPSLTPAPDILSAIKDYLRLDLYVCEKCGKQAYYDIRQRKYVCPICEGKGEIEPVTISYAFKLLLQEMQSLCLSPSLQLTKEFE